MMPPELVAEIRQTLIQYQNDLDHPVTDAGSKERRHQRIEALLAKLGAGK